MKAYIIALTYKVQLSKQITLHNKYHVQIHQRIACILYIPIGPFHGMSDRARAADAIGDKQIMWGVPHET